MLLTFFAIVAAVMASLTGLLVVGRGHEFEYDVAALMRRETNAMTYVWIVSSTILSACHAVLLLDRMVSGHMEDAGVLALSGCTSLLLTAAHVGLRQVLKVRDK